MTGEDTASETIYQDERIRVELHSDGGVAVRETITGKLITLKPPAERLKKMWQNSHEGTNKEGMFARLLKLAGYENIDEAPADLALLARMAASGNLRALLKFREITKVEVAAERERRNALPENLHALFQAIELELARRAGESEGGED